MPRGGTSETAERVQPSAEQSRLGSIVESVFNVFIGYGVAICSQVVIFPMFGVHLPLSDNLLIGAWFTVISLMRSYVIRRWFNARLRNAAQSLAAKAI